MNQDEINKAEWKNSKNWTRGSKIFCVYFSHKDTRTWVPKLIPWMGKTLNLGKPAGVQWLIGILVGIPLVVAILLLSGIEV